MEHFTTRSTYVFTSESVSEGHLDMPSDRIDAVLDAFWQKSQRHGSLAKHLPRRTALWSVVKLVCPTKRNYQAIWAALMRSRAPASKILMNKINFTTKLFEVTNLLHEQSAHIAQGVDAADNKDEVGDICLAMPWNEELMPALQYSHVILRRFGAQGWHRTHIGTGCKPSCPCYENGKPVGGHPSFYQHSTWWSDDIRWCRLVEPYIRETLPRGLPQTPHGRTNR